MPRRPAFESKDRMYLTGSKFRFHCLRPWSRRGSCPKEQTLEMLLNTRANHKNNVGFSSINDLSVACPLAFSTFTRCGEIVHNLCSFRNSTIAAAAHGG